MEVSIKDLMGISPSLTTYIHDRLFPQQLSPEHTGPTHPLIVTTAAVDMHMPVISLTINRTTDIDVLLDGGLG